MRLPVPPNPETQSRLLSPLVMLVIAGIGVWTGAFGCVAPRPYSTMTITMDPPIAVMRSAVLCQLTPGQSLSEVSTIMGDLGRPAARSAVGNLGEHEGHWIEAYQIEADREYERGLHRTEYLWLYFYDNTLIRWGPPFDWPDAKQLPAQ